MSILLNVALPVDCWQLILSLTNDPWVFKRTYLTCKTFADIYENHLPHLVRKYTNSLWILLEMFPPTKSSTSWFIPWLTRNPNTTWEMMQQMSHIDWDRRVWLGNPNITWDIIQDNPQMHPNDWIWLSINPNITWEQIVEYSSRFISSRVSNTIISMNPNLTWEFVRDNPEPFPGFAWDLHTVLKNPNITWDHIKDDIDNIKSTDLLGLLRNPNITWDFIQNHLTFLAKKRYYTYCISQNPNITWDIITDNPEPIPDKIWDIVGISRNHNITWNIIQDNPHLSWHTGSVSSNPNITWEIVATNPNPSFGDWNFYNISCNKFRYGKIAKN